MQQLLEWYPRIYFACHRRHVRDPRSGGLLSVRQGSILDHLDEREPVTVQELARHMGVTASTMSVQVGRLVRTGYAIRERDGEDPRRRNLRLSRAGARIREANSVLDEDRIAEMLERLTPEELEKGMAGLALLAKAAGEITPKEPKELPQGEGAEEEAGGEPAGGAWLEQRGGEVETTERAAPQEFPGAPARGQKSQTAKASQRRRRDVGQPGRGRSAEEEAEVHEVVRELQRVQRELAEMMGGKKPRAEGPAGVEQEFDEEEDLLE